MADNKKLEALAGKMNQLPTLPTVYMKVTELMNDPDSSAADIGRVVANDQAIAARLLRVINSSFFGFRHRIGTVTRAMTMIGFRGLKDMILALSALPALRAQSQDAAFDDRAFWAHAVGCGAGARAAALLLRSGDPEEAFTGGLLHDVGKLLEYRFMKEEFLEVAQEAHDTNKPLHTLEQERLGFTHADVGRVIAEKWRFPPILTDVIAHHHAPSRAKSSPRATALAHLADVIARAMVLGDSYDRRVPPLDMEAWELTGLRRDQIEALMQATDREYEKGKTFISVIMQE